MIVLYTTHCPKCNVLTQKLDAKNVKYDVCDDVDIMSEKGMMSVPYLEVDGEIFDFKQAVDWVNALEA